MDQMEEKLGAILGNPAMMQQIMSMAQSLGGAQQPQQVPSPQPEPPRQEAAMPELDMASLQKLMSFAQQTGIDRNQQNLLKALDPFLSRDRIRKLERAMRAAKLANLATSALGQLNSGR
ncbi:MAG: hypothetical protein IJ375_04490 [Oscillospiraceae bacterium]|nr:hypothetical protein [Oscillospiraceae bacterium]